MDAALQVVANAGPPRAIPWHLEFLWPTVILLAVILAGAWIIISLSRWRRVSGSEQLSANDQLAKFRELYDKGQLSQEEFERIQAQLRAPAGGGQIAEAPKSAEPHNPPP